LEKVRGDGTYVANNPINSRLFKLDGFYKEMEKQGIKVYSNILELKTILPDLRVANLLSFEPTVAVIRVVRLRRKEDLVVGYQIMHLPFKYFPELIY
jgi:DNA-binding GntR family transcriptional regulator